MCSKNNKSLKKIILIVISIMIFGLLYEFMHNFKIIIVDGSSMEPTYKDKQILISSRNIENLKKENVIVFEDFDLDICIKRIVAVPYDTVILSNNHIFVNNIPLSNYTYEGDEKTFILSKNEYFVLGDNYLNSYDSRNYGPIKSMQIISIIE